MQRFRTLFLTALFALTLTIAQFGHAPTAFAAERDCGLCGNYEEPDAKHNDPKGLCGNFDGDVKHSAQKGGNTIGLCGNFDG